MMRLDATMAAPVCPMDTTPWARPSRTSWAATRMELSFFSFRMLVALSSITTVWEAWTTSARAISAGVNPCRASSGRSTASSPTRNRKSPGQASRASRAPCNVEWGA